MSVRLPKMLWGSYLKGYTQKRAETWNIYIYRTIRLINGFCNKFHLSAIFFFLKFNYPRIIHKCQKHHAILLGQHQRTARSIIYGYALDQYICASIRLSTIVHPHYPAFAKQRLGLGNRSCMYVYVCTSYIVRVCILLRSKTVRRKLKLYHILHDHMIIAVTLLLSTEAKFLKSSVFFRLTRHLNRIFI